MNKEKQIEEMAKEICAKCKSDTGCKRKICTMAYREAEHLVSIGYRKASDVARGIFEEIEIVLNMQAKIVCATRANYRETDNPMLSFIAMLDGRIYSLRVMEEQIAELKK